LKLTLRRVGLAGAVTRSLSVSFFVGIGMNDRQGPGRPERAQDGRDHEAQHAHGRFL